MQTYKCLVMHRKKKFPKPQMVKGRQPILSETLVCSGMEIGLLLVGSFVAVLQLILQTSCN